MALGLRMRRPPPSACSAGQRPCMQARSPAAAPRRAHRISVRPRATALTDAPSAAPEAADGRPNSGDTRSTLFQPAGQGLSSPAPRGTPEGRNGSGAADRGPTADSSSSSNNSYNGSSSSSGRQGREARGPSDPEAPPRTRVGRAPLEFHLMDEDASQTQYRAYTIARVMDVGRPVRLLSLGRRGALGVLRVLLAVKEVKARHQLGLAFQVFQEPEVPGFGCPLLAVPQRSLAPVALPGPDAIPRHLQFRVAKTGVWSSLSTMLQRQLLGKEVVEWARVDAVGPDTLQTALMALADLQRVARRSRGGCTVTIVPSVVRQQVTSRRPQQQQQQPATAAPGVGEVRAQPEGEGAPPAAAAAAAATPAAPGAPAAAAPAAGLEVEVIQLYLHLTPPPARTRTLRAAPAAAGSSPDATASASPAASAAAPAADGTAAAGTTAAASSAAPAVAAAAAADGDTVVVQASEWKALQVAVSRMAAEQQQLVQLLLAKQQPEQ